MFENIIGQQKVVDLLTNDILKKSLSNSMIFHGYSSTGKLKTAIELVKTLNCIGDHTSNCNCNNCLRISSLDF